VPGFRTGRPDVASSAAAVVADPAFPSGALYIFDARKPEGVLDSMADETPITSWTNLGSEGGTADSEETNGAPLMRNGVTPTGKPALHFDGVRNSLDMGDPLAFVQHTGAFHIVAVLRKASRTGQNGIVANMNYNNLLSTTPGWYFAHSSGGGLHSWIGRNNTQGSVIYTSAATWAQNTWKAVEFSGDGGSNVYHAQSLTEAHITTAIVNPVDPANTPPFNAQIGGFPSAAAANFAFHSGDLAALYIWDHKLSVGDRAILATFVETVWGVT
jgi:hypothetical protein